MGGDGAFFLLLDEPEVYGLPPDPVVTTRDLPSMWRHAGAAAARRSPPLAAALRSRRARFGERLGLAPMATSRPDLSGQPAWPVTGRARAAPGRSDGGAVAGRAAG